MTRAQALQLVHASPFPALADLLAPAVAIRRRLINASPALPQRARWWQRLFKPPTVGPPVQLAAVFDELTLPIGASRFDAVPDVPIGFEWPCSTSGAMLECLAQIDLSEVARAGESAPLPRDGWLVFFFSDDAWQHGIGHHRVIYLPAGPLVRWATSVPRSYTRQACRLDFHSIWTLPDTSDAATARLLAAQNAAADDFEAYSRLQAMLSDDAKHYLLGHPRAVQHDVRAEAARERAIEKRDSVAEADVARASEAWSLLLQLDSDNADDGPGWMWGDVGTLYFMLRTDAIRAGRFDRSRIVAQCC